MAVDYSYKINGLDVNPSLDGLSDVVIRARYIYSGVDTETNNSGSIIGATPMNAPNSSSFTPLSELTESEIINWIKAVVPNTQIAHMNEKIQIQIDSQNVVKYFEEDLPWATPTE
jgi:hypothetical protein